MSSINYIQDETGNTFIPPTQRPDGTWRRPIRVREGYVPQDEQPLYVSKGKNDTVSYPVGMSPSDTVTSRSKASSLYFEIGNYVPVTKIPGLNFVKEEEPEKKAGKKKKKKGKGHGDTVAEPTVPEVAPKSTSKVLQPVAVSKLATAAAPPTDPVKRLRNLRKKLKDIESLEVKISSGELANPEKEQLEKIQRKDEVEEEIEELTKLIDATSL